MGRPRGPGFARPSILAPAELSTRSPAASDSSDPAPSADPAPPGGSSTAADSSTAASSGQSGARGAHGVVLTAVALIVAVASVLAARDDVRQATPRAAPVPVSRSSPVQADRIEFSTATGTGVLEIIDHSWDSDGADLNAPGALLTVAVRVTCASGTLRYGPDSFQAFDSDGDLFDPGAARLRNRAGARHALDGPARGGHGRLRHPRGGVTLLMSDEISRTVTALKVPA